MISDTLKATGSLDIILKDENGNVKLQTTVPNLITTAGKTLIAERLQVASPTSGIMTHMGVGSDNTPPSTSNTNLVSTLGSRVTLGTTTRNNNIITYTATFGAGVSTGSIKEAGIFNALTAGTMLCRTVFPEINKGATDTLTINWNVTIN